MDPMTGLDDAETARRALRLEVEDGIGWLIFDRPDSRVNLLTSAVLRRLDALVGEIEGGGVRAVIVRSGKDGNFIAGADVREIASVEDPEIGRQAARAGQQVFRRLERLKVPVIAAIDGLCLGGGTELALACDYRLCSDRPETKIGLPEVRLGILPGFGGTTRLPRLIGMRAAVEMILTGKTLDARRAHRVGLVDERVATPALYGRASAVAAEMATGQKPSKRKRGGLAATVLDRTRAGRKVVLWQARKRTLQETRGHYPAPLAALDTLQESAGLSLDEALEREAAALGRLVVTDVSKNLIHVFFLMEAAKKPPAGQARPVDHVAVVGAGVMGGGIAQLLASRGIAVRMKDIASPALAAGLRHAREIFDKAVARRRLHRREAEQALQRISPTLEYTGFQRTDVVIEAVVERMDVKQKVLREVETHTSAESVLTSNTSTLSITEMQGALERPENFCGMHFFNPVHRMPLVEIIRGARSADDAVATVFGLARALDKTPLIVNDGPGFLVNRILAPYLNEASWLLLDGASVEAVDRAMLEFGMPMGPFRLLDEVGFDVARHAAHTMASAFGERMQPAAPMIALEKSERLGKKNERGFYTYENGKEKQRDDSIYAELGLPARTEMDRTLIQDRAVLVMVNEAARVLEDGIVRSAGDVDLGMITGTGFPPFRGGLLRYADRRGLQAIVARLEHFQQQYGPRFEPAPLLRSKAAAGETFYPAAEAAG